MDCHRRSIPIRITEPTLTVDAMNRALQQVGGGWLLCQLSRDGTAITVTPQGGLSREGPEPAEAQSECLARQVYENRHGGEMGKAAQAEALYAYLTEQVRYDFRYYSQPGEMPYSATTAYRALHDHLAICGCMPGVQMLYNRRGFLYYRQWEDGWREPHVGSGPGGRPVALFDPPATGAGLITVFSTSGGRGCSVPLYLGPGGAQLSRRCFP